MIPECLTGASCLERTRKSEQYDGATERDVMCGWRSLLFPPVALYSFCLAERLQKCNDCVCCLLSIFIFFHFHLLAACMRVLNAFPLIIDFLAVVISLRTGHTHTPVECESIGSIFLSVCLCARRELNCTREPNAKIQFLHCCCTVVWFRFGLMYFALCIFRSRFLRPPQMVSLLLALHCC